MIQEAYEVLSDPIKRRIYDSELNEIQNDISDDHYESRDNSLYVEDAYGYLPDDSEEATPFPLFFKLILIVELITGCCFLVYYYYLDLSSVPFRFLGKLTWSAHLAVAVQFHFVSSAHAGFQLFTNKVKWRGWYIFFTFGTSMNLIAPSFGMEMMGFSCEFVVFVLIVNAISAIATSIWVLENPLGERVSQAGLIESGLRITS